jgi:hypothetical protein
MKKKFAIISHKKMKDSGAWNGYKAHNERATSPQNVDKSRSHLNITLKPNSFKNFDEYIEKKREYIREKNKENGTKNRCVRKTKNKKTKKFEYPSVAHEFVFSYSHGALTDAQGVEYLKLADKFLEEWFGKDIEKLQSTIHLDEKTPHIHIDYAYFDLEQGKFCQKDLQRKGKTDISRIREEWDRYLATTEFAHLSMQDGSVVAKDEHTDKASLEIDRLKTEVKEWKEAYSNATAKLEELEELIGGLKNQVGELKQRLGRSEVAEEEKDAYFADFVIPEEIRLIVEMHGGQILDEAHPFRVSGLENQGVESLYDLSDFPLARPQNDEQTAKEVSHKTAKPLPSKLKNNLSPK